MSPSPDAEGQHATTSRSVLAAAAGNLLEWYDFTVYALFAIYIAQNFFASGDSTSDLLKAFLGFGAGFVARPIGAVLIGAYGDYAGRKAALTLTMFIMAAGTLVIAAAPTYAAIGIGAPLLLVAGRLLQGFSAGGEIGSAAAFLVESAPSERRGLFAAWLQASMGASNILGALVAYVVTSTLAPGEMQAWGWRVPFIVGLAIVPVALYLRRTLKETGDFRREAARRPDGGAALGAPLGEIFRHHARALLIGFALSVLWAVATYVLIIYTPVYVQKTFGFAAQESFRASLIGNVVFVATCFAAGALSDRFGRTALLAAGAGMLLLGVYPLFAWLQAAPTAGTLIAVQSVLCLMAGTFVAVAPSALADIFPVAVRSTGTSLVYNGAFTVFGGFAPAILTWLTRADGGSALAPAWYVIAAAATALVAVAFFHAQVRGRAAAAVEASAVA